MKEEEKGKRWVVSGKYCICLDNIFGGVFWGKGVAGG